MKIIFGTSYKCFSSVIVQLRSSYNPGPSFWHNISSSKYSIIFIPWGLWFSVWWPETYSVRNIEEIQCDVWSWNSWFVIEWSNKWDQTIQKYDLYWLIHLMTSRSYIFIITDISVTLILIMKEFVCFDIAHTLAWLPNASSYIYAWRCFIIGRAFFVHFWIWSDMRKNLALWQNLSTSDWWEILYISLNPTDLLQANSLVWFFHLLSKPSRSIKFSYP